MNASVMSEKLKEAGELFNSGFALQELRGEIGRVSAIPKYNEALTLLDEINQEEIIPRNIASDLRRLYIVCYVQLARAYDGEKNTEGIHKAIQYYDKSIRLTPDPDTKDDYQFDLERDPWIEIYICNYYGMAREYQRLGDQNSLEKANWYYHYVFEKLLELCPGKNGSESMRPHGTLLIDIMHSMIDCLEQIGDEASIKDAEQMRQLYDAAKRNLGL